jgi:opacity protein-like surface antigen
MSPRLLILAALAGVALAALPARPAAAQSHPLQPWERRSSPFLSVGADAVFSSIRARAVDSRIGDGVGFDAHASVGVSALSIGAGYQRTTHSLTGTTEHATYSGYYVEPRVALDLGAGNFTPYLAGRVGRTRVSVPPGLAGTTTALTGTTYAAGGGLAVWLTHNASLDLGALWSRLDLARSRSARDVLRNGEDGVTLRAGLRLTP